MNVSPKFKSGESLSPTLSTSAFFIIALVTTQSTNTDGYFSSNSDRLLFVLGFAVRCGIGKTVPPAKSLPSNKDTSSTGSSDMTPTTTGPEISCDSRYILYNGMFSYSPKMPFTKTDSPVGSSISVGSVFSSNRD